MTFRTELEDRIKAVGRGEYWCRNLPTAKGLLWAFLEYPSFGAPGEAEYFPGEVHRLAAGLAAAHYQHSGHRVRTDDIFEAWVSAETELAELPHHMDRTIRVLVPQPQPTAPTHDENFGAFISRLAHTWLHATPRPYGLGDRLDDRGESLRRELYTELLAPNSTYSILINNLNQGLVRLQ